MRRSICRLTAYFIGAVALFNTDSFAQPAQSPNFPVLRVPRISQGQKITQVIGLSEVTIYYHRPGVKGRTIFGPKSANPLEAYGEVWRAGANEPTIFTFSDEVTIAGKKVRAGSYRFVTIPGEKEWTAIFNSEVKNWGTVYEEKYDTLRFPVTPQTGSQEEWLSFSFTDMTPASATVVLAWDKVRLPFKIEFNTVAKLQTSVGTWQILNSAARSAIDHAMYTTEAMDWADRSIAMNKNYNNLRTKAELLAMAGKTKEALAAADECLKLYKAADPKSVSSFTKTAFEGFEKTVANWKTGKTGTN
ncbi:MAG: DUF2911 domain-containing protein [Ignavibacteriales bacterium]|nr:DUF2911 domain-containing protein [Ignavibacteriales bacterium]